MAGPGDRTNEELRKATAKGNEPRDVASEEAEAEKQGPADICPTSASTFTWTIATIVG